MSALHVMVRGLRQASRKQISEQRTLNKQNTHPHVLVRVVGQPDMHKRVARLDPPPCRACPKTATHLLYQRKVAHHGYSSAHSAADGESTRRGCHWDATSSS